MNQASVPRIDRSPLPPDELEAIGAIPAPTADGPLPPRPRRVDSVPSSLGPLVRKAWPLRAGSRAAAREQRNGRALLDHGVRTPVPVGWLPATKARGAQSLTLRVAGARDLADAWAALPDAVTTNDPGPRRRAASHLLVAAGHEIGALHRAGFVHGDLHARNLLVDDGGAVWVADLARLRRGGRAARDSDLHALWHHFASRTMPRERLAFLIAHGDLPLDRAKRHRRLRRLAAAAEDSRQRFLRHHERRCDGSGREFERFRRGAGAAACRGVVSRLVAGETRESLLRLLAGGPLFELPKRLEAAGAVRVHRRADGSSEVWRLAAKDAASAIAVKWFDDRGALRRALRGSRARRAWRSAFRLRMAEVAAPGALLFAESATARKRPCSALVTEFAGPAALLDAHVAAVGAAAARPALCAVARLIARLHDEGLSHRDLKAQNLLVLPDSGVVLVDGDGLARRPPSLERVARDLMRLNASFRDDGAAMMRARLDFVADYRAARRRERPARKPLLRRIALLTGLKWQQAITTRRSAGCCADR
jgi:tRNA A-37 threonylcarbamoyl transferase component Bud32